MRQLVTMRVMSELIHRHIQRLNANQRVQLSQCPESAEN
jgi:hypothetical protein